MNKALGIGAAVLVGLFALAFWFYGNARYDTGVATCKADTATTTTTAATESARGLERVQNETAKMSPDAIDADLAALGILRADTDR